MTLVVPSTLERGLGAGSRVAIAPLETDAPIIGLTVLAVSSVSVLRALGIAGGLTVAAMGVGTVARSGVVATGDGRRRTPLRLFLLLVGSKLVVAGWWHGRGRRLDAVWGGRLLVAGGCCS